MLNFQPVPDKGPEQPEEAPVRRIITQMAFDLRLTSTERKAIRNAAKENDDVNDAFCIKEKATYIDLDAEITAQLLGVMVMAGCLQEERIPEILGAEVQPGELYKGPI